MSEYFKEDDPQDQAAAATLAAKWEGDLEGAYRYFMDLVPMTWVQNEANQILKRNHRAYWKMWDDAWEAIVAEERRKSREYEKWFHRNDVWNEAPNLWKRNDEQN